MHLRNLLSSLLCILLSISHLRSIINSNLLRTSASKISCPHLLDIRKIILMEATIIWCVNLNIQTVVIVRPSRLTTLDWRPRPIEPCCGWHLDRIELLECGASRSGWELASFELLLGGYLLLLPSILHQLVTTYWISFFQLLFLLYFCFCYLLIWRTSPDCLWHYIL